MIRPLRALPAQEGLGADEASLSKRRDRLEGDVQLVVVEGAVQSRLEHVALLDLLAQRDVVQLKAVPTVVPCPVHGQVRIVHEDFGTRVGRAECDADAGGDERLSRGERERLLDRGADARGALRGVRRGGDAFADEPELVRAAASDGVRRGQRRGQPVRHGLQHDV